ncbi:MAG: HypC/HybG/HupF family hydrogenase formation chaperone [Solirubrobacterales bacterium]
MTDLAPQTCDHTTGCITCGDEAIPMEVLRVDPVRGLALCATTTADAAESTVETALVEPVAPGDRLLVHAGTAIGRAVA